MQTIFLSADIIHFDGSDTGPDGDPTEPGHGSVMNSGWYQPYWSLTDVYENREDVAPETFAEDGDGEQSPGVWLAEFLWNNLPGFPEDNGDGTWYSGESYSTPDGRYDIRPAAHAEGFSDAELDEARGALDAARRAVRERTPMPF